MDGTSLMPSFTFMIWCPLHLFAEQGCAGLALTLGKKEPRWPGQHHGVQAGAEEDAEPLLEGAASGKLLHSEQNLFQDSCTTIAFPVRNKASFMVFLYL